VAHLVCNIVQTSQLHFFLTYDPKSPDVIGEPHWSEDLDSHTIACVWVASQQVWRNQMATAQNWQSSDTAFEWNDAISELLLFLR